MKHKSCSEETKKRISDSHKIRCEKIKTDMRRLKALSIEKNI